MEVVVGVVLVLLVLVVVPLLVLGRRRAPICDDNRVVGDRGVVDAAHGALSTVVLLRPRTELSGAPPYVVQRHHASKREEVEHLPGGYLWMRTSENSVQGKFAEL